MAKEKKFSFTCVLLVLILCSLGTSHLKALPGKAPEFKPVADEMIGSSGITWIPKAGYSELVVTITRPDSTIFRKTFPSGSSVYLDLSSIYGDEPCDGSYTYELRSIPPERDKAYERDSLENAGNRTLHWNKPLTQVGYFSVKDGALVVKSGPGELSGTLHTVEPDDMVIQQNLCVGYGCESTESFGSSTIKLKKNYMEILFTDISTTTGYPTRDWKIKINDDDIAGGGSYFTIGDVDGNARPFTIKADAPESSLYVDDYGRIGLGTAVPAKKLHLIYGDTPAIRLEQDSSGGYTAQVWDIGGSDTQFFVRDVTNGSKLPLKIQPNTPDYTLVLNAATGADPFRVGIGTTSPGYPLELETTGANAAFVCDRTDGAKNFINATTSYGQFGTVSNHPMRILVNSTWKLQLNSDNSLSMASGASCTAGGTWTNASSRALKENIQSLGTDEAMDTLNRLNPVKFNYKVDKAEKHVGFIAEDAPELVATKDRKGMSPMDVVAVLTKVLQEQQKTIDELKKEIAELKKK